ncbi:hypothetical protein BC833DRAFT_556289 [Globomyces pollinis-pini]|nr:hypothetical protein BC833DRAFT_556289 [Globomyces pollinis-pini]
MSIQLGRFKVPIVFKYNELSQYLSAIEQFTPFLKWQSKFSNDLIQNNQDHLEIHSIEIQDLDFFGKSRIGFLKFKVDLNWLNGPKIPGIVFCRGDSVAILLVLKATDNDELNLDPLVLLVKQPRIPIGSMSCLELPAGMLDNSTSFAGVAAQELKEECDITIVEKSLIPLTDKSLTPSPGGCDESIGIFLYEHHLSSTEIMALNGKLTGLRDHGERIQLQLVKLSNLHSATQSLTVLAALGLYNIKIKS